MRNRVHTNDIKIRMYVLYSIKQIGINVGLIPFTSGEGQ